ncbi:MAG: hypothetical protein COA79_24195 [Planctomycetota bacterium]|nr:MAG: hypothetical protein COA79_24195 [Planctomycetota bacterium]
MDILIIDDDEKITNVLSSYLNNSHNVTVFNNPIEALEYYKINIDFDVVITDFLMPHLRGDELIDKILDINLHQEFIVMSGFFQSEFIEHLKSLNYNVIMISKPFEFKKLDKILDHFEFSINI